MDVSFFLFGEINELGLLMFQRFEGFTK